METSSKRTQRQQQTLKSPIQLTGVVKAGTQQGRTLGFPTVNITANHSLSFGSYCVTVVLANNESYRGAGYTNQANYFEVYLLDFAGGNLYGQTIHINLHHFIRSPQQFTNTANLINAIAQDVTAVRLCLQE